VSLGNCGWASLGLGDHVRAADWFREALVASDGLGIVGVIRGVALGLAAVAVADGENERAAKLLGAEARMRDEIGLELDAFEEQVRERTVAEARTALGGDAFAAAFARGDAMTQDEILELAATRG